MKSIPRIMISAPSTGSGKSVITTGLMAAFSNQFPVQGFKVGPDYIDPMYHTAATGRPSRNLDAWMLPEDRVQAIFLRADQNASLSIIEGVMGLFDGYGSDPLIGSSAGIAALMKIPIVLVLDCSEISGSAAAVVHGFNSFCDPIRLSGVICNRVGGEQHGQWLKEAIEARNPVPVLGCIPRLAELQIPERHLGLFTVAERQDAVKELIDQAQRTVEKYLDLERILKIANAAEPFPGMPEPEPPQAAACIRLAVARDEAFCFYYEDNLDELRRCGAEIVPFSPLMDEHLPEGISGIYLGGGYPELYAERLSQNSLMCTQLLTCIQQNMPVYAECGGLMYLTEGIRTSQASYSLVGAVPGWCEMSERLSMGYREVQLSGSSFLGEAGSKLRGHEFHYSRWQSDVAQNLAPYSILNRKPDKGSWREGYSKGNLLASYIHIHFSQNPLIGKNIVQACLRWSSNKKLEI
ncbi:MAG: cobyrinate a,c-diamide synthase [Anaerolineaceae bacterium]|nr:cobyrinate a,c-diamide synthase [Anaerolineaceae bacterium]